jgi:mevalonate pyrophosphate decarboxylase
MPGPAESSAGIAALKAALLEHARIESSHTQVGTQAAS